MTISLILNLLILAMPFSSHLQTWEPQAVESAQAAGEYSVFVTLLNDLQKRGRFRMDLLNLTSNV